MKIVNKASIVLGILLLSVAAFAAEKGSQKIQRINPAELSVPTGSEALFRPDVMIEIDGIAVAE